MAETFKSNSAGDPTVLARMYLLGGADYRQEWTFDNIDSSDAVVAGFSFATWKSVVDATGWTLKIGPTATSVATVTSTDISLNADNSLIVRVDDAKTTALQQAYTGSSDTSQWYGVLWGYNEQGDVQILTRLTVILQHMPL